MKKTGFMIAALSVILILLAGGFYLRNLSAEDSRSINISALEQQIISIGELATVEYNYKNVLTLEDSHQIKGFTIPLTQKSVIAVVEGTMKIGINAADILVDASEQSKTISITIPKAKILSHEVHEDTIQILNEKSGLFNPIRIEDWNTLAAEQKQAMAEEVSQGELFARAENDAANMLQTLIKGIIPADYTVQAKVR